MKTVRAIALLALICCPLLPFAAEPVTVALRDHGRALLNPGMGWTMHFYSNLTEHYGSKLEPSDTLEWFEGCSVVYLRLPWAFLEPSEGDFRWSLVDTPAQRWISRGKKVAFRFTTSENWLEYATPHWVEQAGAKMVRYTFPGGPAPDGAAADPVFDDPVYLAKLRNFLRAAGARYNGNPDVAFIDVGTFGLWGEGHTLMTQRLKPEENERLARIHIDLHKEYFPDTQLVISDDVIGPETPGDDFPLMRYCRERGISLRDDSILVQPGEKAYFHAELARAFWPELPVVLEHEHYGNTRKSGSWNGETLLRSVEEYHASYLSIHWWPEIEWRENVETIRAVNRRLGYRIVIPELTFPAGIVPGVPFEISIRAGNAGVAPPYRDLFPAYTLTDERGGIAGVLVDETLNFRRLPVGPAGRTPLTKHVSRLTLDARAPAVKPGRYTLSVSVGRRDGNPEIALPYDGGDSRNRIPVGSVEILKEPR